MVKDYWLEAIKDVFYRKPFTQLNSFRRVVGDVILTIPGSEWTTLGFTLEDLGYKEAKIAQWSSFYYPTDEAWKDYEEKVKALSKTSTFAATFSLPLKGEKRKEDRMKDTRGNCLLDVVVGLSRAGKSARVSCKIWVFSRSSEIFTKFGADLYFTHTLLVPKLLEVPRMLFSNLALQEVRFYLCSSYIVAFRLLGLSLWSSPVDIIKEAYWTNYDDKQERIFLRQVAKDILTAIKAPETLSFRSRAKISYLYREAWKPFEEEIKKLKEEIENVK